MLIIDVRESETIDKALKKYKRKFEFYICTIFILFNLFIK